MYQCPRCRLVQTDLRKNYQSFVKEHYSKEYFSGDPTRSAYVDYANDKEIIVRNLKKYLQAITKIKPRGTLLDAGCAMGFFVELARNAGYQAYGFDPSAYAVSQAKKLVGAKFIQTGTTSSVKYPYKKFDIITLLDVFEHLGNPIHDLERLSSFLKDDGIILIATGDTDSVAARVLQRRWTFYIPPQHLFFFNKTTLTNLLHQVNLQPVQWFRVSKWLSLRYMLHLAKTTGESTFARYIDWCVQFFQVGKIPLFVPLQDNMVVIVRKK